MEQGHEVAVLLTFKYMDPYIFHSFPIMELQSKASGIPQLKVEIKDSRNPVPEIQNALARLKEKEGFFGFVTGDIAGAGCARVHQVHYELMCDDLGLKLIMPLQNPSGDTYDVLKEEISAGIKPMMNCVNAAYFGDEWLGRALDEQSIKELKALADKHGIDVCSEDGIGYHTMVLDAPFFKEIVEIENFNKRTFKDKRRTWLYVDAKKPLLKPK